MRSKPNTKAKAGSNVVPPTSSQLPSTDLLHHLPQIDQGCFIPNETCNLMPSACCPMALIVASTILPPESFTMTRAPTVKSFMFGVQGLVPFSTMDQASADITMST
jgi:hypothetical protein